MNANKAKRNAIMTDALNYIDEDIIAEVVENLKTPLTLYTEAATVPTKKSVIRSLKYVAAVAACALLLNLTIPVVQYLSKNLNLILPSHTLGETSESPDISSEVVESEFDTEVEETIDPIEDTTYLGYLDYNGIEPISEEKMLEVRRAWGEWVYKETYAYCWKQYTEYPDPYLYPTKEAQHERALKKANLKRMSAKKWFNMRVEGLLQPHIEFQRYYGTVNDYVVLATLSTELWMMEQANVYVPWDRFGIDFYCMIYLYKDGEFIEFNYAFDNGLISASQANKIVTRHRFYDKNLDAWWAEEKSKLTD